MNWWWKIAAGYLSITVGVIVMAFVITESVELVVGKDERNLDRSGRWRVRLARLASAMKGGWTLGMAWTFAVFLMANLGMQAPGATERWALVLAVGCLFSGWVVVLIVLAGVNARHMERIDQVTGRHAE